MNFHILGAGSIGSLIATHLRRSLPRTQKVTLISRRPGYSVTGGSEDENTQIKIHRHSSLISARGFDWESINQSRRNTRQDEDIGASVSQSDLLRDLVFQRDGSVNPAFGYGTLAGRDNQQNDVYENAQNKPRPIFRQAVQDYRQEEENQGGTIDSLIVTTKAHSVLPAIESIQHRLQPTSTVVLLHNGMGVYEELVDKLYRNARERPHFVLGMTTHGVWKRGPYEFTHTSAVGSGGVRLGIVPDWRGRDFERTFWQTESPLENGRLEFEDIIQRGLDEDPEGSSAEHDYSSLYNTLKTLSSLRELGVTWESISSIQTALRQKLTCNTVINPLTAMMEVRNGELFNLPGMKSLCHSLCKEAANVFAAEKQASEGDERILFKVDPLLNTSRLEAYTMQVARQTSNNFSSMLVDLRRAVPTEIAHLNGHISKQGEILNVPTPTHDLITTLIKAKWHASMYINKPIPTQPKRNKRVGGIQQILYSDRSPID